MPAYMIDYLWAYNPHGPEGTPALEQEIPLRVRYHVQPDEPEVNVKFSIEIEEVWQGNIMLCTDADIECGWYENDEERLLDWLYDGAFENGAPAQAIEARRAETGTGSVHESAVPAGDAS